MKNNRCNDRMYILQNENIDKFVWIQDPLNSIAPSEFISTEEERIIELSVLRI